MAVVRGVTVGVPTVCWRSALTSAAEGQPLGTAVVELCTVVWWCLGLRLGGDC